MNTNTPTPRTSRRRAREISPSPRRTPRQRIRRIRDDAATVVPLTQRAQQNLDVVLTSDSDSDSDANLRGMSWPLTLCAITVLTYDRSNRF
jgi:hypothetical protein